MIKTVIALLALCTLPLAVWAGNLSYPLKQLAKRAALARHNGTSIKVERYYTPTEPHLRRGNGAIEVQVQVLYQPGEAPAQTRLSMLGFTPTAALPALDLIEGWLPVAKLKALAALASANIVRLPDYGIAPASIVTQGDTVIRADKLRAAGLTGRGITVGLITSGIEGIQKAQDAGELPADISIINNKHRSGHEGVWILEIIHDIAPAAHLAFCGARSEAGVVQCVQSLKTVGAGIVDIDLEAETNPFSPRYLSQIEALAREQNILLVSAVGNFHRNIVNTPFTPVDFTLGNGKTVTAMDFGRATGGARKPYDTIQVPPGAKLSMEIWWDDNPNLPLTWNSYGLYLLDRHNQVLASATPHDVQIVPPALAWVWRNKTGAALDVRIVTALTNGSGNNRIALLAFDIGDGQQAPYNDFLAINTPGDIAGQDLAQDVLSVGAVNVASPDRIMPYSNQGPTHVAYMYDPSTGHYAQVEPPIMRIKPNVVAPTNVSVLSTDSTRFTFGGTSAAAPHVTGAAALLKSYGLSKAQVVDALENSAIDLGDPGKDNVYGAGRIDAFKALESVDIPPDVSITTPARNISITAGKSVTFKGECASNKHKISAYAWDFDNGQTSTQADPAAIEFKKAGVYNVTLSCTDSTGIKNPDPATRIVTAITRSTNPPDQNPKPGDDSGGGAAGPPGLLWLLLARTALYVRRRRRLGHTRE